MVEEKTLVVKKGAPLSNGSNGQYVSYKHFVTTIISLAVGIVTATFIATNWMMAAHSNSPHHEGAISRTEYDAKAKHDQTLDRRTENDINDLERDFEKLDEKLDELLRRRNGGS